ncbi:hypothetical protein DL96DRAFT_1686423 [Flagelloscypha sp. PMI_526]|nr:hypothetical protein DL96DRAFT_1686423 [Flagelloscypha sp. PMI_526]
MAAEAIAVAAVALAAPPCIRAVIETAQDTTFWVKMIGTLRLSFRARGRLISSHIIRVICKIREELIRSRVVLSADQVNNFVDKLNRKISLFNKLVKEHSVAETKARVHALQSVKKSLIRLRQDIKILSRTRANEKLFHDLKLGLDCDENVTYPDGTIASYHPGGVQQQPLTAMGTPTIAQDASDVVELPRSSSPAQSHTSPTLPIATTSTPLSSQRVSLPFNLVFTLAASTNPSVLEIPQSPNLQQS